MHRSLRVFVSVLATLLLAAGAVNAAKPGGGPSVGSAYSTTHSDIINFAIGTEIDVATLSLPAGSYVVQAKVQVGNRANAVGESSGEITCVLLWAASGGIDISDVRLSEGGPFSAGSVAAMPLGGGVTLNSATTIRLRCGTTSADAWVQFAQLQAIVVSPLTVQ